MINDGGTNVNWFNIIETRFIRIVPTARYNGDYTNCIRMELFGCAPKGPFIHDSFFRDAEYNISDVVVKNVSFHGTAPESGPVNIIVTTTTNHNQDLSGTGPDQFSFSRVDTALQYGNGSIADVEKHTWLVNPDSKLHTSVFIELQPDSKDYFSVHLKLRSRV